MTSSGNMFESPIRVRSLIHATCAAIIRGPCVRFRHHWCNSSRLLNFEVISMLHNIPIAHYTYSRSHVTLQPFSHDPLSLTRAYTNKLAYEGTAYIYSSNLHTHVPSHRSSPSPPICSSHKEHYPITTLTNRRVQKLIELHCTPGHPT